MRSARLNAAVVVALVALGLGCTKVNSDYCAGDAGDRNHKCLPDAGVDHPSATVDAADGGDVADTEVGATADAAEVGDGATDAVEVAMDLVPEKPMCSLTSCPLATPICDVDAGTCDLCMTGAQCKARDATKPGCDHGLCYPCVTNAECTADVTMPICESHACRICKADTECGGPGICLESGKCALETEVVHLDSGGTACGTADGTSAKPYCTGDTAVAALTLNRPIVVVHGPNGPLTLSTTVAPIVIVGKKNAAAEDASLSVGVGAGLTVTGGNVFARDLTAVAGTSANSKGVVASGATTKLRLLRVNVSTVAGLGVQADTGATLTVNRCIVQNNSVGGLLVNGARANVTNSVFATNGYGVKFNLPATGSTFESNTVVGNTGNAATCDTNNAQSLADSILVGFVDTCTVTNCLVTAPTFDAARPYHLAAKLACPATPAAAPPDDLDGDPRTTPIDCGADQFVATH